MTEKQLETCKRYGITPEQATAYAAERNLSIDRAIFGLYTKQKNLWLRNERGTMLGSKDIWR